MALCALYHSTKDEDQIVSSPSKKDDDSVEDDIEDEDISEKSALE